LTKRRTKGSTQKFLNKAIGNNRKPRLINIDKSGSNTTEIRTWNKRNMPTKKIKIRRVKYLNNIVKQDHRSIKKGSPLPQGLKNSNPRKEHSQE